MRIAGIIAEYDPFHKGHAAHIAATRSENGGRATHIVAVISGNFTQRGEPAMLSKFTRARMALAAGADLILELPLCWAMAPAESFAAGGVALLHALGCVEELSFGSECGDMDALKRLAHLPSHPEYQKTLRHILDTGIPYAAAGQAAAEVLLDDAASLPLAGPNNTLGIEYIRAAERMGANFGYYTLTRQGALHHESAPNGCFASASLLRERMRQGQIEDVTPYMPDVTADLLLEAVNNGSAPSDMSKLEAALLAHLRRMSTDEYAALPWLSEGLENRLFRCSRTATSLDALLAELKTRRYPMARLRRVLWASLIGITDSDTHGLPPYIRVLGMNHRGREILSVATPTLPVITRTSQVADLDERAQRLFHLECVATDLHGLTQPIPAVCGADHTHKFIVME